MKLEDIARTMKECVKSDDPEGAHGAGDDLLIEAINTLGQIAGREDEAKEIVAQWRAIEKWCA